MGKQTTLAMMPFFVRDYLAATRHMTLSERGAFMDLLCFSWDSGGPIPKNRARIAALLGCTQRTLETLWPAIRAKLTEVDGGYISERLEAERLKSLSLRTRASQKAALAAASRWGHREAAASGSASSILSPMLEAMIKNCPPSPAPSSSNRDSEGTSPHVIDETDPAVKSRRALGAAAAAETNLNDAESTITTGCATG